VSERKRRGLGFTSTIGSATFTPSFRFALPGEIDEVDVDPDKASDKVDVTLTSTLGGVSIACLPNTTRKLPILIRADLRPTRDEFRSPPSARASRLRHATTATTSKRTSASSTRSVRHPKAASFRSRCASLRAIKAAQSPRCRALSRRA